MGGLAKQKENNMTSDPNCICQGNWRNIVKESESLIEAEFRDTRTKKKYVFVGILHGKDDYYYAMRSRRGKMMLLSCVGSPKTHGFELTGMWADGDRSMDIKFSSEVML